MAASISQRISLEGSDELRKKFEELGKAGEKAFTQISDAAKKPIGDPRQLEQAKQVLDQLVKAGEQLSRQFGELGNSVQQAAQEFGQLANSARRFGDEGTQAAQRVTEELKQTEAAAQGVGTAMVKAGQESGEAMVKGAEDARKTTESTGAGLLTWANTFKVAAAGVVASLGALAVAFVTRQLDFVQTISDQAEKLNATIPEWMELRNVLKGTGITSDDLAKRIDLLNEMFKKAAGGIATLSAGSKAGERSFVSADGNVVTLIAGIREIPTVADKAATAMRQLGISSAQFVSEVKLPDLRRIADQILAMADATKQAELATALFGPNWQKWVQALHTTRPAADQAKQSLLDLAIAARELTAEEVIRIKEWQEKWGDLGKAVFSVGAIIRTVFAGPTGAPILTWLTQIADKTRELFREWNKLDEAKREAFVAGLPEGGIEAPFKILIAIGQQLAGLWNGVLVPAGRKVVEIFKSMAGGLQNISAEQVAAGFVTATVAVTGLAIAFKGLALVTAPVTAFFSLFSGFGLLLVPLAALVFAFWDQIKEAAGSAFEAGSGAMTGFRHAMEDLFKGDFRGFWRNFSNAAVLAFQMIVHEVETTQGVLGDFVRAFTGRGVVETPWVRELIEAIKQIGIELPATLAAIALGFVALRRSAGGLAAVLNRTFGTKLNADAVLLLGIMGPLNKGFDLLATAIRSVAFLLVGLSAAFALIGQTAIFIGALIGAPWALVAAAIVAVGVAVGALILYWDDVKQAAADSAAAIKAGWEALKQFFTDWVSTPVADAWGWVKTTWDDLVSWFAQKIGEGKQFLQDWVGTPVADAWGWIKTAWDDIIGWIGQKIEEGKQLVSAWVTTPVADAWGWLKSSFQSALEWAAERWAAFKAKLPGGAAPAPGGATGGQFASGGLLGGRGSGTSDSNLAWVSRGEYIIPARAVGQPGVLAFLELLRRSGGNLGRAIAALGHFASGGLAGIPHYQTGGRAGGRTEAQRSTLSGLAEAFVKIAQTAIDGITRIGQGMNSSIQGILSDLQAVFSKVADFGSKLGDDLHAVIDKLSADTNSLVQKISGVSGGFARGGLLGGRGTGTSDSNLAWLSRGEYVTPANAVRQPGVLAFLEALRRSGGNLRAVLDGMGRYALGGLIPNSVPALAGGGLGGLHPVTINFAGTTVSGLRATGDVVDELRKAAVLAQVRSGGRKPSRYS